MGVLRIVLGSAGSGKTEFLYTDVTKRAEQNYKKNFIILVPEQSSHLATGEIMKRSRGHGILNIDVLGFTRFAHRIFSAAGGNERQILDDTGKNLILRRVAAEEKDKLKALKKSLNRQGYISEIKSVISEYIQYDVDENKIVEEAEKRADKNYLAAKTSDIAVLYRAFKEKLGKDYITNEELLDLAAKSAEKADFLRNSSIYFDDFTGFTPIQYRFIRKMMEYAEDCTVALNYDGYSDGLFHMSIQTISNLRKMADETGWKIETINLYDNKNRRASDRNDLLFLERNIFRKKKKNYEGMPENIKLVNAPFPSDEASFVCSKIREAVSEKGMRYRDCAIVMSDVEEYASVLEREGKKYDIPLFIDAPNSIELNPFTEFIRAAIAVETDNYSFESVMHFLRSGISGFSFEETDIFENYIRAVNIRGRKKYSERWVWHTKNISEEELESINLVREKIVNSFNGLDKVMTQRNVSAKEYTLALREFIESYEIKEKLEKKSVEFENEGDVGKAAEYSQIYDKLSELFDRIEELIPNEKMPFKDYLEILNAGLDEIRVLKKHLDLAHRSDGENVHAVIDPAAEEHKLMDFVIGAGADLIDLFCDGGVAVVIVMVENFVDTGVRQRNTVTLVDREPVDIDTHVVKELADLKPLAGPADGHHLVQGSFDFKTVAYKVGSQTAGHVVLFEDQNVLDAPGLQLETGGHTGQCAADDYDVVMVLIKFHTSFLSYCRLPKSRGGHRTASAFMNQKKRSTSSREYSAVSSMSPKLMTSPA